MQYIYFSKSTLGTEKFVDVTITLSHNVLDHFFFLPVYQLLTLLYLNKDVVQSQYPSRYVTMRDSYTEILFVCIFCLASMNNCYQAPTLLNFVNRFISLTLMH